MTTRALLIRAALVAALPLSLTAVATFAKPDHGGKPERWEELLERFDADEDGRIEATEFTGPDQVFDFLDVDDNGVVDTADRDARREWLQTRRQARALRTADQDGDGATSLTEWRAFIDEVDGSFASLDADADGIVTAEELPERSLTGRRRGQGHLPGIDSGHGWGRGRGGAARSSGADQNEDGVLSAEEWQARFQALDTDGDGILTRDELRQGRAGHGERRRSRAGR